MKASASKYLLFAINLVTLVFGLVLFFLGVVLQTTYANYDHFLETAFHSLSLWCVCMGVAVCVISFLGKSKRPPAILETAQRGWG